MGVMKKIVTSHLQPLPPRKLNMSADAMCTDEKNECVPAYLNLETRLRVSRQSRRKHRFRHQESDTKGMRCGRCAGGYGRSLKVEGGRRAIDERRDKDRRHREEARAVHATTAAPGAHLPVRGKKSYPK